MNTDTGSIIAAAAAWHAASARDDMDWNSFADWLEADPAHRQAYDEVALADALVDEHGEALRRALDEADAAETPAPPVRSWKRWAGAAIAASLVALLAVPQMFSTDAQVYQTAAASRSIALADGSTVLLAPHSSLTVEGNDHLALSGGGWFDIRHDPARRLEITAGDVTIGDIGTAFDVQVAGRSVRVKVAEGEVEITSPALSAPLRLTQGRGLLLDGRHGTATVADVATSNAGEWRQGRLTYDAAPLALVAADLGRYAGLRVAVPERLGDRPFSGTLFLGDGGSALRDLAQVMQLDLATDDRGYRLTDPATR